MIVLEALPGLQVDSPLVAPGAVNFQPPSWPPPDDFPVIIDADGSVVSCYGDHTWNLAPWAGKPLSIAFGDSTSSRGASVSAENGALFRQIAAWWLYGPNAVMSATSLASRHTSLKPLFVACSEAGILASNLSRFPRVIDVVASRFVKANANRTFGLLHILHEARDELGFELLDATGLKQLSARLPERESVQTPYIPPRIWTYQVLRLRECLDDYLTHRDKVEACFRFCMQAYRRVLPRFHGHFQVSSS